MKSFGRILSRVLRVRLHESMMKYCHHRCKTYGCLKSNTNCSDVLSFCKKFWSNIRPGHARQSAPQHGKIWPPSLPQTWRPKIQHESMNYSHSLLFKGRSRSDFRPRHAVKMHQNMIKYCYHRSKTYGGLKSDIN